jgi:hypothetical protein
MRASEERKISVQLRGAALMKICTICKQSKEGCEFNKNKSRRDGLQSRCRSCDRSRAKAYYYEKHEISKQQGKARRKRYFAWYKQIRQAQQCNKCGEKRWYVLDFHHTDETKKSFTVSNMLIRGLSRKKILEEIAKCVVLCANCHREEHYLRRLDNEKHTCPDWGR